MHQIVCRLRVCPRPHWRSLQRSPEPVAGFKGPTSEGQRKGGKVREEREGRGRRRSKGKGGARNNLPTQICIPKSACASRGS